MFLTTSFLYSTSRMSLSSWQHACSSSSFSRWNFSWSVISGRRISRQSAGTPPNTSMSWWWMAWGATAYALDALWMKMHAACSQLPHGTKRNEHDAQDGCNNYTEYVRTAQCDRLLLQQLIIQNIFRKKYDCLQENCFLILHHYDKSNCWYHIAFSY